MYVLCTTGPHGRIAYAEWASLYKYIEIKNKKINIYL
jgi:hypothetical protein